MIKMRFHWDKSGKTGSFTVTSSTVEECIEIANEEIDKFGAELDDWYVV